MPSLHTGSQTGEENRWGVTFPEIGEEPSVGQDGQRKRSWICSQEQVEATGSS